MNSWNLPFYPQLLALVLMAYDMMPNFYLGSCEPINSWPCLLSQFPSRGYLFLIN